MPTSIAIVQIKAPLSDVYRYISTPHLLSEWVVDLSPGSPVGGDGEVKLGMRASDHRQLAGTLPGADPEVVGFKPDESVSMSIESKGFIMLTRFHLFESDGITTVRQMVSLDYKRWFKLFVLITNRSVQRRIEENLANLKQLVESKKPASTDGLQSEAA